MVVALIGNGTIVDYAYIKKYIQNADIIFACDGGLKHCDKMELIPDCLLGDFDSVDKALLERYKNMGIELIRFPVKKDCTDIELGIELAFEKNPSQILVFGGIGSRMDHSLANIHLLSKGIENNVPVKLINEHNEIFAVRDNFVVENRIGQIVSLLPLTTEVDGVTTKGFEYPLEDFKMRIGTSLGVSNVIVENVAEVSIKRGVLLVVLAKD